MATHAHSTSAPAVQPRLLPFVFRPVPPVDDPRSADELLEEIRRTIEGQEVSAKSGEKPELRPEPLLLPPAPLASLTAAFAQRRAIFGPLELRGEMG